jgi:hypothetical protein
MAQVQNVVRSREELDEQIDEGYLAAFGAATLVTDEGEPDTPALADKLTSLVEKALANSIADRPKVCITRRGVMQEAFPSVPGPESWPETDDPELAAGIYGKLDQVCWRMMATGPSGPVQSRLNGGLVLCRTTVNPHRTQAVYVTRDYRCITEDLVVPMEKRRLAAAGRDGKSTSMFIERVPEFGERFHKRFTEGLREALTEGTAESARMLDAVSDEVDDDE